MTLTQNEMQAMRRIWLVYRDEKNPEFTFKDGFREGVTYVKEQQNLELLNITRLYEDTYMELTKLKESQNDRSNRRRWFYWK